MLYLIIDILSEKVRYEIEYKFKKAFLNNKKNDSIDKFSNSVFKNDYLYNSEKLVSNYYFKKIDIFIYTFAIILSFVFTSLISWEIAILAFFMNMIIILTIFILKNKNAQIQKDYAENRSKFIKESSKIFDGSSDLQAFNRTEVMDSFLNEINNLYYKNNLKVNRRDILYSSIIRITSIVVTATISIVTILMSREGIISLYVIISLIAANTTMNAYMNNVFSDFGKLKSMNKLMEDMNILHKPEITLKKEIFPISTKSLYFKTRNKTLSYPDICIRKNNKYILSGRNGVGKSILLRGFQGTHIFGEGEIKYNKYNRKDLNVPTISSKIISLRHEPLIFKGSILENLFISKEDWDNINKEFHFITKNFNDYNSEATLLSLGEKQMIAILRSLISNKELIIIDEGLDAVSKDNKDKIENYLDHVNKTIIYVSHTDITNLNWKEITIY
ncbi:ABC transporter ATP-binding protein [Mycoplasma marinum]|nr:ABC transporter ATP-binding protein [Mycoplasma marinum]